MKTYFTVTADDSKSFDKLLNDKAAVGYIPCVSQPVGAYSRRYLLLLENEVPEEKKGF